MFATVAGGKEFLARQPAGTKSTCQGKFRSFFLGAREGKQSKNRDELYVLCANEGSQHDDEGWVMRRRCKRGGGRWIDDASWFESLEVNSILGKNWRHYSPSTGSVFIVVVC